MKRRIEEIMGAMKSFTNDMYSKEEVLPELMALQKEMVNLTFNEGHADSGQLKIWDVVNHLETMNADTGETANEKMEKFKRSCYEFSNLIKGEISGKTGEQRAFKSIETMNCKYRMVKNVELKQGDHRTELDVVVITEKAAFIIEVKNTMKDICIDERGNYCRVTNDRISFDKNIGERMNEKVYLLREAFDESGIKDVKIESLVVFTNSGIRVENRFPYIETCYLSDLPHKISKYEGDNLYDTESFRKMLDAINEQKCHEKYSMEMDMNEFKREFAVLVATLEQAKEFAHEMVNEAIEATGLVMTGDVVQEDLKEYNKMLQWMKEHAWISKLMAKVSRWMIASLVVANGHAA